MKLIYFEDAALGETHDAGSHEFTEDEIIRFAKKYDPQPAHMDPIAAANSPNGGLTASCWHVIAIWMKLMITARRPESFRDANEPQLVTHGSPGFRDMRWPMPVRPGDTISYTTCATEKVELNSRPNLGIIRNLSRGVNQHGDLVVEFTGQGMVSRRPS
jgi:acyl dehydratase